jgi:hypothetical protein
MNEDQMHRLLMIAGMCLAVLAGIGTISVLVMCAMNFSLPLMLGSVLLAAATIGFGWSASFYGNKVTGHPLVFTNEAEREVLTPSQRKELRRARGEVVMERAMIEIQHEKDNIVHRQIEAANDPNKPPHITQWTDNPVRDAMLTAKQRERDAEEAEERLRRIRREQSERGY